MDKSKKHTHRLHSFLVGEHHRSQALRHDRGVVNRRSAVRSPLSHDGILCEERVSGKSVADVVGTEVSLYGWVGSP